MSTTKLTARQQQILEIIDQHISERGYPPSVREIGKAIGLTSPSSVQNHLNRLNELGYLRRDPVKPRALEVRYDPNSGASGDRRPFRHVPLVGDVAAGTDVLAEENVEEILPVPSDFCGDGELFMLRVRGESMIEAGILDGDYALVKRTDTARDGEIVVALVRDEEATLKYLRRENGMIRLDPANGAYEPQIYRPEEVQVQGKLSGLLRRYH